MHAKIGMALSLPVKVKLLPGGGYHQDAPFFRRYPGGIASGYQRFLKGDTFFPERRQEEEEALVGAAAGKVGQFKEHGTYFQAAYTENISRASIRGTVQSMTSSLVPGSSRVRSVLQPRQGKFRVGAGPPAGGGNRSIAYIKFQPPLGMKGVGAPAGDGGEPRRTVILGVDELTTFGSMFLRYNPALELTA